MLEYPVSKRNLIDQAIDFEVDLKNLNGSGENSGKSEANAPHCRSYGQGSHLISHILW